MASKNIGSLRRKLDASQKKFLKTKQLSERRRLKEWTEFFSLVSELDSYVNKAIKRLKTIKIVLIVIFVLYFFIAGSAEVEGRIWDIILFALLALILIVAFRKGSLKKTLDIHDSVSYFLLPVLYFFTNELGEKARLKLNINLERPMQKKFLIKRFTKSRRTVHIYGKPIYEGEIVLTDKTVVNFDILLKMVKIVKIKRSSSGKTKVKTKFKYAITYKFKIHFPKDKFKPQPEVTFSEENNFYVIKTKRKYKRETSNKDFRLYPEDFIDALVAGFKKVMIVQNQ